MYHGGRPCDFNIVFLSGSIETRDALECDRRKAGLACVTSSLVDSCSSSRTAWSGIFKSFV